MSRKAILSITPELLHACLGLPPDITIECVFEASPHEWMVSGRKVYLALAGESLPIEPLCEGQACPQIYGIFHKTSEAVISWEFRKA